MMMRNVFVEGNMSFTACYFVLLTFSLESRKAHVEGWSRSLNLDVAVKQKGKKCKMILLQIHILSFSGTGTKTHNGTHYSTRR